MAPRGQKRRSDQDDAVKPPRKSRDAKTEDGHALVGIPRVTRSQAKFSLRPAEAVTRPEGDTASQNESKAAKREVSEEEKKAKEIQQLRTKKGFTPGLSPFKDHQGPSAEACEHVYQLLAEHHRDQEAWYLQKDSVPRASRETAGCGEVRKVIDALLRTVLSGATRMENANRALKGLDRVFGLVLKGTEEETINWDKVRRATSAEVVAAILSGGLAIMKTGHIKGILDLVYAQGLARIQPSANNLEASDGKEGSAPGHGEALTALEELEADIAAMEMLSLEHLRTMSKAEAMTELIKFDGVGVKTAACVALFCLRMDCFAVDTHVHRFCRWLGWVPPKANDRQTFNHCDLHVPDHLKYGLHQLFIIHGQQCFRCKSDTRPEASPNWDKCVCPLEDVIDRQKSN